MMTRFGLSLVVVGMVLLAAAAPLADAAGVTCSSHQYADDGKCKNCVSQYSPFHKTLDGNNGHKCYYQEGVETKNACVPTNIPVKIRSADPTKLARCINPNDKEHAIILPLSNSQIPNLSYVDYKKATLRLQGLNTKKTTMGHTAYSLKTSGVTKGLAIIFVDNYGILKKRAGLTIELVGVLRHPYGLDRCFVSSPVVCPV